MSTSGVAIESEMKSRGYLGFKVIESTPSVCTIRGDNTMIALETAVQKIIETDSNEAEIYFVDTAIAYTGKAVRFGSPLQEERELEFDMVQDGKVVCRIDNGVTVSLMPIIMEVNRAGVRLPHGEEKYDVVNVTRIKTEPAPK